MFSLSSSRSLIVCSLLSVALSACTLSNGLRVSMDERSSSWALPADSGYNKGVAGAVAGYVSEKLLFAGGCNFPEAGPADGGAKVYYDDVFVTALTGDSLEWKHVGKLHDRLGYAATCVFDNALIVAGGKNGGGELTDVVSYSLGVGDSLSSHVLPPLPESRSGMASALIGSQLYLIGGSVEGKPSTSVVMIDLMQPDAGWIDMPPLPGTPWIKQTAAAVGDTAIVVACSFAANAEERDHIDQSTYFYVVGSSSWEERAPATDAEGKHITFGGGMAAVSSSGLPLFAGGIDTERFHEGLANEAAVRDAQTEQDTMVLAHAKEAVRTYLTQPEEWYRFNNRLLAYDATGRRWIDADTVKRTARADAACVTTPMGIILISGELKPGVRTPQITLLKSDD